MSSEQQVFTFVIDILEKTKIPYMIGGSVAAIVYGEPRMTLDMDVVVDIRTEQVKQFVSAFGPEYYVNSESILEAIKNQSQFNIIQSELGVKVDFYVKQSDSFSQQAFGRKRSEAFSKEKTAMFTTPEDIILKKMEWYKMGESQKHLDDIKGILRISRDKLDLQYISQWALKIGVQDIWQQLIT